MTDFELGKKLPFRLSNVFAASLPRAAHPPATPLLYGHGTVFYNKQMCEVEY